MSSFTIAAASTTDIGSADAERVSVTGTASITSLGAGFPGCKREVSFTGSPTLVHSASLLLPGAANITVQPNDTICFRCASSGSWVLVSTTRPNVVGALGYTPVNRAGDTMTGALTLPINGLVVGPNQLAVLNGKVGVGTAIPPREHTVRGAGAFSLYQATAVTTDGVGDQGVLVGADGAGFGYYWNFQPLPILFGVGGVEVGRFATGGGLELTSGLTLLGGRKLKKITVVSFAPGTLEDGELFLRY